MFIKNLARGYRRLLHHRDITGYRRLPLGQRLILDHLALWRWVRTPAFWRTVLHLTALVLAIEIICMELDLRGMVRNVLRALPPLGAAPLVALARHRHLRAILQERTADNDISKE